MDDIRCLVVDAHVRATFIVESYEASNPLVCLSYILVKRLPVEFFRLYDTVNPFSNTIVGGLIVFCHAYTDSVVVKFIDVSVAAVLHASVRMVYKLAQVASLSLPYCLLQGLYRILCLKRGREAPSDYLPGIRVSDKMQVAALAIGKWYVCYVAHPQEIRSCRDIFPYQVLVLVVSVVGIGGMARARTSQTQTFAFQKGVESVTTHHAATEHIGSHEPYLASANAGIFLADGTGEFDYRGLAFAAALKAFLLLIPGLSAMAKQFASGTDGQAFPLAKSFYRLAPDFFRIWIPCSSAMSIIVLSARFWSFDHSSSFFTRASSASSSDFVFSRIVGAAASFGGIAAAKLILFEDLRNFARQFVIQL